MPTINSLPPLSTGSDATKIILPVQEKIGNTWYTKSAYLSNLVTSFGYGYIGSQGEPGEMGDTGYTGSASTVIGYTGSQGSGYVGSRGSTGFVGSSGSQGPQGFIGSVGSQGFIGSTGFTGSYGLQGFTGSLGNIGYTGSLGNTGYIGSKGTTSFTRGATWVASSGAVTTATNDVPIIISTTCTLQEVVILTQGGTGSCTVDIWKAPYANYPPTVANTICGGTLPAISSGIKYQNNTLSGWTTSIAQGDVIMFRLQSSSVFTQVSIQLSFQ